MKGKVEMEKGYYIKEEILQFRDCDYLKRAKLSTIMGYLADVAGLAYAQKGYSHGWLWENGFVFLLSRVSMRIKRIPKADEKIAVHTWEKSITGSLFNREFAVYDEKGTRIIDAGTQWVMANPHTRTIMRPSAFTGEYDFHPENEVDIIPPAKLKLLDVPQKVGERKIYYSDIDANAHVYNAVYAAIACDFLDKSQTDRTITDFRINFKKEATQGDTLTVAKLTNDSSCNVIGYIGETISFETEFTFG